MVYIDASRYNNTDQRTGVENYSYFLINELIAQHPEGITLISPKKIDLAVKQIVIPFPRLWTQIRLSWEIFKNKKINNLFVPSHLMPIFYPKKTTITIHDVAFRRFPESYGRLSRWYLHWGASFAVKNAEKIIVPSEITKQDLVHFYRADENKILVVPLGFKQERGNRKEERGGVLNKYHLKTKKYFLFVGRIETKKNIQTLLKAFEMFSEKNPDCKLVLAGKPGVGFNSQFSTLNSQLSKNRVILTGYIGETEKNLLMANALCFVFPSLFEGFGIPLLEAMEFDLPIIASDIPSSREVAGDNALFFDTYNADQLALHMENIIKQPDLRKSLTKNHSFRLNQFSWKKCAQKTFELLKSNT